MVGRTSLVAFATSALLFSGGGLAYADNDFPDADTSLIEVYVDSESDIDKLNADGFDLAEYKRVELALLVTLGGDLGTMLGALDRRADAEALRLDGRALRRVRVDVDEDLAAVLDPLVLGEIEAVRDELVDVRLAVDVDLDQRRIRIREVVVGIRQTPSRKQQR